MDISHFDDNSINRSLSKSEGDSNESPINGLNNKKLMNASMMTIADLNNFIEEDNTLGSKDNMVMDYTDVISYNAFAGEVPYNSIIEGIENQFSDYIKLEDKTNYIDIFYEQLHESYNRNNNDTAEFHKDEINKILDDLHDKFIYKMAELFNTNLTLTISSIESESFNNDEVEFIIRRLYEFFILNACNNFKVVISKDIVSNSIFDTDDNREYLKKLRTIITNYTPLITTFGPMEFLKYKGDQEIIDLFEDGKVVGNFLRKYSPKLYQNQEFEVELISYISMLHHFKKEALNNGKQ